MVDVTDYSRGVLGHDTAITSPAFLKIICNMRACSQSFGAGVNTLSDDLPSSFIAVQDADQFDVGAF